MGWWEDLKTWLAEHLPDWLQFGTGILAESMLPPSLFAKFMSFIIEEALQTGSMGIWQLIRVKKYDAARAYSVHMHKMVDAAKEIQGWLGELEPVSTTIWDMNLYAVELQLAAYDEILGGAPGEPVPPTIPSTKSKLIILSEPSWAKIDIDGEYIHHVTPEEVIVYPGSYRIRLYKKDYEDYEEDVTVTEGEVKTISKTLVKVGEEIPEVVTPPPPTYTVVDSCTCEYAKTGVPTGRKSEFLFWQKVYGFIAYKPIIKGDEVRGRWYHKVGTTWEYKKSSGWVFDTDAESGWVSVCWTPNEVGEWKIRFVVDGEILKELFFTLVKPEVLPGEATISFRVSDGAGNWVENAIFMDGSEWDWGKYPEFKSRSISPGVHRILVTGTEVGWTDWVKEFTIADGETMVFDVEMEKA